MMSALVLRYFPERARRRRWLAFTVRPTMQQKHNGCGRKTFCDPVSGHVSSWV